MVVSKIALSGSTNGKPIDVASVSQGAGTAIHTAVSGTLNFDEVWLFVVNHDSVDRTLNIQFGAATDTELINVTLAAGVGLYLCVPGMVLQNSLPITAWADSANKINVLGYVNRYEP